MSTTAAAENENGQVPSDDRDTALPLRSDTILGVCEAVGQDLGFNADWLRIPFAALILWNPPIIVGCYLGLGFVVAITRWLFPIRRKHAAVGLKSVATPQSAIDHGTERLPIAA